MDWTLAIERNREALRRVLAMLVAMAGLGGAAAFTSPLWGGRRSSDRRVGVMAASQPPPDASRRPPHKGEVEPAPTLPRHLHRAVLRLLRPAESATRRLIIVAAREIAVHLPPSRRARSKPDLKASHAALRGLGIAVVMSHADIARAAAEKRAAEKRAAARAVHALSLPLLDPLPDPLRRRPCHVPAHATPRILSLDGAAPYRLPPPSPADRIDATRLTRRLAALAAALDDLPGQARRFARWQARCAQNRGSGTAPSRRRWPLRSGRPPGQHPRNSRRPAHEVHDVLADLHWFATPALQHADTS